MRETKIVKTRREEYSEATRLALMAAGREAFAREGYQTAGVEGISRAARVTRGAFYHHFEDKKALFDAVVVALQVQAAAKVEQSARSRQKVRDRLTAGIDAYLDVCLEPDYARIVIQDAPAILGNERYREIEEANAMALLAATLEALKRHGELDFEDTGLLTRMIDAMICKVALMLPEAEDAKTLRARAHTIIDHLLGALSPGRKPG